MGECSLGLPNWESVIQKAGCVSTEASDCHMEVVSFREVVVDS